MDLVEVVRHCLREGTWQRPRGDRLPFDWLSRFTPLGWPDRRSEFYCQHERERWRWAGESRECARLLQVPHRGDYHGSFAPSVSGRRTRVLIVGDSVAGQLDHALRAAAAANANLSRLTVSHARVSVVPATLEGSLRLLRGMPEVEHFAKQACTGAGRHVVLVQLGAWYNLLEACLAPLSRAMGDDLSALGPERVCTEKVRRLAQPNHSQPSRTAPLPGFDGPRRWMWRERYYPWARRAEGTTTIAEWPRDLATLLEALAAWRRESVCGAPVELLVAETLPQHFHWNSSDGCRDGTPQPFLAAKVYLTNGSSQLEGLATRARVRAEQAGAPVENWHNALVAPLLVRLGVPTVPLFAALRTRGELHKPGDCLHLCEASEATQHTATAVLAVLAAS